MRACVCVCVEEALVVEPDGGVVFGDGHGKERPVLHGRTITHSSRCNGVRLHET